MIIAFNLMEVIVFSINNSRDWRKCRERAEWKLGKAQNEPTSGIMWSSRFGVPNPAINQHWSGEGGVAGEDG